MSQVQRREVLRSAVGIAGLVGAGALGGADPVGATGRSPGDRRGTPRRAWTWRVRLVFLSHVNDPAVTNVFPGDPEFTLETVNTIPEDGFYMQYVREAEHTGSHWGAPAPLPGGRPDGRPARPGRPVPAGREDRHQGKAAASADYAPPSPTSRTFERRHGPIPSRRPSSCGPAGRTGGAPAYPNFDSDGVLHQPGFGIEAAEWLVDHGKLGKRGSLGTDTFRPTSASTTRSPCRRCCSTGTASAWRTWPTSRRCRPPALGAGGGPDQPRRLGLDRHDLRGATTPPVTRAAWASCGTSRSISGR